MTQIQMVEFPMDEVQSRLAIVSSALIQLGPRLLEYQEKITIRDSHTAAHDRQLMQAADLFAEKVIVAPIQTNFTKDRIHSEEAGTLGEDGEFEWWIDPVDGTRNFIHGLPLFCCSVGLAFRGTPIAGIVLVPALGDTYTAVYGSGANKNSRPIRVTAVEDIRRALVVTGLPYHRDEIVTELLADISAFVSSGTGLRRTGSAILDMCWIAEGRFDAMWERGVKSWDLCAAAVILGEAGGKLTSFTGGMFDLKLPEIIASNGAIHNRIVEILSQARSVEGIN